MYIPIILGTGRKGRESERVAEFVLSELKKREIETEIIDARDYAYCITEAEHPKFTEYKEKAIRASGFIIVSPEYNHGYPGELKILLDSLYDEYVRKPVGLAGVSIGTIGGARMMEQLKLVCHELGMIVIHTPLYFPKIKEATTVENKNITKFLDELLWFTEKLK